MDTQLPQQEYDIVREDGNIVVRLNKIASQDRPERGCTQHGFDLTSLVKQLTEECNVHGDEPILLDFTDLVLQRTPYMDGMEKKQKMKHLPIYEINLRAKDHLDNAGNALFRLKDLGALLAETISDQQTHYSFLGKEYALLANAYDDVIQEYRKLQIEKYKKEEVPYEENLMLGVLNNKAKQCLTIAKNFSNLGRDA